MLVNKTQDSRCDLVFIISGFIFVIRETFIDILIRNTSTYLIICDNKRAVVISLFKRLVYLTT